MLRPDALRDLENIWWFGAQTWSPDQADRYSAEILDALSELAAGRRRLARGSVSSRFEILRVGSHHVYLRRSGDTIDVVRILHQAQDPARHLPTG